MTNHRGERPTHQKKGTITHIDTLRARRDSTPDGPSLIVEPSHPEEGVVLISAGKPQDPSLRRRVGEEEYRKIITRRRRGAAVVTAGILLVGALVPTLLSSKHSSHKSSNAPYSQPWLRALPKHQFKAETGDGTSNAVDSADPLAVATAWESPEEAAILQDLENYVEAEALKQTGSTLLQPGHTYSVPIAPGQQETNGSESTK
jgi:hypothetical protein